MSIPIFLHIMSNGDLWVSTDTSFTPSGTVTGTYRINSDCATQKIDTITGSGNSSASALATPKKTGKNGTEIK